VHQGTRVGDAGGSAATGRAYHVGQFKRQVPCD